MVYDELIADKAGMIMNSHSASGREPGCMYDRLSSCVVSVRVVSVFSSKFLHEKGNFLYNRWQFSVILYRGGEGRGSN